jgi:hypothetical protein
VFDPRFRDLTPQKDAFVGIKQCAAEICANFTAKTNQEQKPMAMAQRTLRLM